MIEDDRSENLDGTISLQVSPEMYQKLKDMAQEQEISNEKMLWKALDGYHYIYQKIIEEKGSILNRDKEGNFYTIDFHLK